MEYPLLRAFHFKGYFPFALEVNRVGQEQLGQRINHPIGDALDSTLRLFTCPSVHDIYRTRVAEIEGVHRCSKELLIAGNERGLHRSSLAIPDRIGGREDNIGVPVV